MQLLAWALDQIAQEGVDLDNVRDIVQVSSVGTRPDADERKDDAVRMSNHCFYRIHPSQEVFAAAVSLILRWARTQDLARLLRNLVRLLPPGACTTKQTLSGT